MPADQNQGRERSIRQHGWGLWRGSDWRLDFLLSDRLPELNELNLNFPTFGKKD